MRFDEAAAEGVEPTVVNLPHEIFREKLGVEGGDAFDLVALLNQGEGQLAQGGLR